mmetsp:Transcript_17814/g.40824  ORF Transcript_17814/g.40824 Transcript_17814/m.40824 type:complete len:245 (-) Transcript_17814:504-1238(-)
MAVDSDAFLDMERSFRREVRKAYYRREADFLSLDAYNDYLEEVETLIMEMLSERTRAAAQARLRKLSKDDRELTARNRALFDDDRRALAERASLEHDDAKRRVEERVRGEQEAAEEQARVKAELLEKIASGKAHAAAAQSLLQQHALAASAAGAASSQSGVGANLAMGLQAQALPQAFVQPLQAVPESNGPKFLMRSRDLKKEAYEDDKVEFAIVCAAGGLVDSTRKRYRQEAFDERALRFIAR